jgi:hypothetical protein
VPPKPVSQEVVHEFQLSSVNMDLSTVLGSSGAINIVTRSGGNHYHGSGFFLYRDHHLAAYPGLQRDASNPDPSFSGSNSAISSGDPFARIAPSSSPVTSVTTSEVFFRFSHALRVHPTWGHFPHTFRRQPVQRSLRHAPPGRAQCVLPSYARRKPFFRTCRQPDHNFTFSMSRLTKWVDQSQAGLRKRSVSRLVNDLRFAYSFFSLPEVPASIADCPGCLGVSAPVSAFLMLA